MDEVKADFLMETLACFICGFLPLVLIGVQVKGRPNLFSPQIANSGNIVKAHPVPQLGPSRELRFNLLAPLIAGKDPEVVIFRYSLNPAPANAAFRSSRRATGIGTDQHFESAMSGRGLRKVSDATCPCGIGVVHGNFCHV
jgi:hypothetical protein